MSSKEYIEREALVKEISDIGHTAPMTYAGGLALALNSVRSAPTADVVPVVRCKDCSLSKEGGYFCTHPMGLKHALPNYFCFHGDRRE